MVTHTVNWAYALLCKVLDILRKLLYDDLMASVQPIRKGDSQPVAIHAHAMDNLRYIRETMERAGSFTAVPGWGGVAMGITALIASVIAAHARLVDGSIGSWLTIWIAESVLAISIGILAMWRKASRAELPMWSGASRKFVFSFVPPLAVGAALTGVLWHVGAVSAIPGVWLMLYGTGVVTGGAFSSPIVPVMGACFLVLGGLALLMPAWSMQWADVWLAVGFGGVHIVFGAIIAKRYGG
jgi:hypothetical protein